MDRIHSHVRDALARMRIPWRNLIIAIAIVLVTAGVVALLMLFAGRAAGMSAYFAVLLLISPARRLPERWRLAAGVWTLIVSVAGFLIGPFGLGPLLIALVVVCLVQGLFRFGEVSGVTRSPVNVVVFAGMSGSGAQLWQVVLGSAVAVVLVMIAGRILRAGAAADSGVNAPASVSARARHGVVLAVGCVGLVVAAEALHFDRASWAVLSLCMILAVEPTSRGARAWSRVVGTIAGVVAGTFASALPEPLPMILAFVSATLCIAYIRGGDYTLFVMFLTPAILLTASGSATWYLAVQRVEAVVAASLFAIVLTAISLALGRHLPRSIRTAPGAPRMPHPPRRSGAVR